MKKVVVVIPVYRARPTQSELESYHQCIRTLNKHPIVIIKPQGLSLTEYEILDYTVTVKELPAKYFNNIQSYNALMLSLSFYMEFMSYEYMLIYQLDAWVFSDSIIEWCNKKYHYLGAPWVNSSGECNGVGNGGFSLRHIAKSVEFLQSIHRMRLHPEYANIAINSISNTYYKTLLRELISNDQTNSNVWNKLSNEDGYWAYLPQLIIPDFKTAPLQIAMQFSMETNPEYLYRINNNNLPFGCHAWEVRSNNFWTRFIKLRGNINNLTITRIFYNKHDISAEITAVKAQRLNPSIVIKSTEMEDKFQLVDGNNNVYQGTKAESILEDLLSPTPKYRLKDDMINILIRTSNRPNGFKRMIESIRSQTYNRYRIIASVDNDESESYVKKYSDIEYIRLEHTPRRDMTHNPYNLYFNELINKVEHGWIFFVDDDDVLPNTNVLASIICNAVNPNYLYIFKANFAAINRIVPGENFGNDIIAGGIATPNIIVHSSHARDSKWPDKRMGDYTYITGLVSAMGINSVRWVDEITYLVDNIGTGNQTDIKATS